MVGGIGVESVVPQVDTQTLQPLMIGAISAAIVLVLSKFHFVILGVLYGMALGALPGMGGTVTLALLVPLTIALDPMDAFILIAAAWGATTYAGSISAIIINTPGTGSNAATLLDGYPLTRQNLAGYALGASAAASALGAIIAISFFILLIPVIATIVLAFGVSEYFWLILIGVAVIPMVTGDNMLGGLLSAAFGLLLSLVGMALATGESRFTMGQTILLDGFDFIAVLIGLFAIAEILKLAASREGIIDMAEGEETDEEEEQMDKIDGVREVLKRPSLLIRSSLIGLLIGIVPGVGGVTAGFIAYAQAQETSEEPEKFGKGSIEGVIAPEGANDAKDGGQLFPTLGLGIPGSASAAVVIGAFYLHGVVPDTRMLVDQQEVVLAIAFALLFSNIMTSVIGLGIADYIVWILRRSTIGFIFPTILVLSVLGTFTIRNNIFDVFTAMVFGVIGFYLLVINVSRVPMLIAFILGIMAESNFFIALQINSWSYWDAFFTGWISRVLIFFLALTLLIPVYKLVKNFLGRRGSTSSSAGDDREKSEGGGGTISELDSIKVYATFLVISVATLLIVQYDISIRGYNRFETIAFPQAIVAIALIAVLLHVLMIVMMYRSDVERIWIDAALFENITEKKLFTLAQIGLLFAFLASMYYIGFFVTTLVFCFVYSLWAERKPIHSVVYSVLFTGFVYYLLIEFLGTVRILRLGLFI